MRTLIALAVAIMAIATYPAAAAERTCRPSLSNGYHCPDSSTNAPKSSTETANPSGRACRPSLSNFWTCPETSQPNRRTASPKVTPPPSSEGAPRRYRRNVEREERPSSSSRSADQYATETQAAAHCPRDTVVWLNTRSGIYHFQGTRSYGNTVTGAYMCERDSLRDGMRAAKNETHP
jgi:hypothetical protein